MRATLLGRLLVGIIASVALLACTANDPSTDGPVSRSFSLSTDPSVVVISRTSPPGFNGQQVTHKFFADGQYIYEHKNNAGPVSKWNKSLSLDQLNQLVGLLVEGGVIDTSGEELTRRVFEKYGRFSESHPSTITIHLELASYRRNGEELGPISKTIRIRSLGALHMVAPEVEELGALMDFIRQMHEYGKGRR